MLRAGGLNRLHKFVIVVESQKFQPKHDSHMSILLNFERIFARDFELQVAFGHLDNIWKMARCTDDTRMTTRRQNLTK